MKIFKLPIFYNQDNLIWTTSGLLCTINTQVRKAEFLISLNIVTV